MNLSMDFLFHWDLVVLFIERIWRGANTYIPNAENMDNVPTGNGI